MLLAIFWTSLLTGIQSLSMTWLHSTTERLLTWSKEWADICNYANSFTWKTPINWWIAFSQFVKSADLSWGWKFVILLYNAVKLWFKSLQSFIDVCMKRFSIFPDQLKLYRINMKINQILILAQVSRSVLLNEYTCTK